MRPIVLLTDFGLRDVYVGVMKGVIESLAPGARTIDLCHEVRRHDVAAGAFLLATSFAYFPEGSVFLAVVDPGVGSSRRPIAVKTARYLFVGPDNGLLSDAISRDGLKAAVVLENRKLFLPEVSRTFHGRDVFAPCAARLARGEPLDSFGRATDTIGFLPLPFIEARRGGLDARILYVDGFGNLVTNIPNRFAARFRWKWTASLKGRRIGRICGSYAEAPEETPFFIPGGFGYLEISVKNGSAGAYFSLGRDTGAAVRIRFPTGKR